MANVVFYGFIALAVVLAFLDGTGVIASQPNGLRASMASAFLIGLGFLLRSLLKKSERN